MELSQLILEGGGRPGRDRQTVLLLKSLHRVLCLFVPNACDGAAWEAQVVEPRLNAARRLDGIKASNGERND